MFTYATKKNRYGDEHIAVSANGAEIATIKPSSYYGNTEYIVSATIGGDDRGARAPTGQSPGGRAVDPG